MFVSKCQDEVIWKSIQMPLHIGVILFVLISGYFSIKASSKGVIKYLGMFFVLTIPETIYTVSHADSLINSIIPLFALSKTHFWFKNISFLVSSITNSKLVLGLGNENAEMVLPFSFWVCCVLYGNDEGRWKYGGRKKSSEFHISIFLR